MYPKNAASPEPIAIGAVVQISDGAVQTSGCTVRIKPIGVAEGDGGGTTAYSTDGIVLYTPTQAETNYTSFILIAKKTGCIPVSITVVTTATATPGTVNVSAINSVAASSVTTVGANVGTTQPLNFTGTGASALVKGDMVDIAGAAVSTSSAQIGVNVVNAAGTAWGSGAITAASIASDAITAAKIATGAITASKFAADAIDSSALAASAASEIGTAVWATATRSLTILDEDSTTLDLDATIRAALGMASASYDTDIAALPTAAENADAVWDEAQSGHTTAGTFGKYLDAAVSGVSTGGVSAADIADAVWDEARSGHATAGTFGAYVLAKTDGDEAIAAAATALSTAQWTSARAGYLDNINNANLATVPAITGDAYARLGAPAGASVSADIAAVKTDTGNLVSRITSTLFSGITQLSHWLGMLAGKQAANSTALTEIKATGAGSGTYDPTTDSQEALRDNTGTAGAGLTAADDAVITAIAALNNISTAQVNAEVDTALSDWGKTGFSLVSAYDFAKGTVAMTESYAADGAAPTPVQSLMLIQQALTEVSISGTTMTIKKLDGSTTAATLTLNDGTTPTAKTRAS